MDKEAALLLSLRPRFPLSLLRSLFREEHRSTETLGLARRRLAVDSDRHSRIAVNRSCASTSSSSSPSHACWEAVISSPSSKYRVAVVELRRRFRRRLCLPDLADHPEDTVVRLRITSTLFPSLPCAKSLDIVVCRSSVPGHRVAIVAISVSGDLTP